MKFSKILKKRNSNLQQTNKFIANPNRHFHTILPTFKSLFFFLIIIIPVFIFSYIVYNSEALKIYTNYLTNDYKHIWNYLDLPNGYRIIALLWTGYGFIFLTIIGFISFGFVAKNSKIKDLKVIYAITIVVSAVVGILLVSLSQYSYSKFFEFFQYEGITTTEKYEWAEQLSKEFSNIWKQDVGIFNWEPSAVVWWVMFIQVAIVFVISVSLQNSMYSYSNEITDYERYVNTSKDNDVSFSKFDKLLKNLFSSSDKNIAILLIGTSLVIIIPNFIYAILLTVNGTNLNALISWAYKVPTLIQDMRINDNSSIMLVTNNLYSSYYGSLFPVVSLQIIFVGITIATSFFFVAILLRGRNISSRIFVFQGIILFVELIATISIATESKIIMHHLADFWMANNNGQTKGQAFLEAIKKLMGANDFGQLKQMFATKEIGKSSFDIEWLNDSATIAESIIAFTFVFGAFTMITNNIYKLGYFKKKNVAKYESGILNS